MWGLRERIQGSKEEKLRTISYKLRVSELRKTPRCHFENFKTRFSKLETLFTFHLFATKNNFFAQTTHETEYYHQHTLTRPPPEHHALYERYSPDIVVLIQQ